MRFVGSIYAAMGAALTLALSALTPGQAQVVTNIINDGTTVASLVRLSNSNGAGSAESLLTVEEGQPYLVAEQSGYSDFYLRSVWHPPVKGPTEAFYTVRAEVQPLDNYPEYRPGVAGWIDVSNRTCFALEVQPGAGTALFALTRVDFNAAEGDQNSTTTSLYNLDGSDATLSVGSAWGNTGDYDATQFATFEIVFVKPSTSDKAALANVTARIEARVLQSINGQQTQVGDKISLLTAAPAPVQHRLGYFAYYASTVAPGDRIGFVKNLTYIGPKGPTNASPSVEITAPTNGTTFVAPATVEVTVAAADTDGVVVRTELYEGATLLTNAPSGSLTFSRDFTAAGEYALQAKAVDDEGATTTSSVIKIKIQPQVSEPLRITNMTLLPNASDFAQVKFTVVGNQGTTYWVQRSANLVAWTSVSTNQLTGSSVDLTLDRPAGSSLQFYRLVAP